MRTTLFLTLVFGAFLAGCSSSSPSSDASTDKGTGGSGGTGGSTGAGTTSHCDINNNGTQTCIEWAPDYTGSRPQGCTVLHGTYADGACSATNSSGGCRQNLGTIGTQTTFYYMPAIMPADVMAQCTNDGNATYVAP